MGVAWGNLQAVLHIDNHGLPSPLPAVLALFFCVGVDRRVPGFVHVLENDLTKTAFILPVSRMLAGLHFLKFGTQDVSRDHVRSNAKWAMPMPWQWIHVSRGFMRREDRSEGAAAQPPRL